MFKGLFGKKKNQEAASNVGTLAAGVRDSILSVVGGKGVPPMPGAAQKAFQLATDPKAEARDFIEVIESDEGLSARVLKIANSVYFDRGKKSTTIEESVLVIGINELRSLLNATTLAEIFPSRHPARPQLWSNDIGTAIIARTIAQRFASGKTESAFLGGLMHDMGKLFLLQRSPEDYAAIMKAVEQDGCDFCTAETNLYPFNHTEVGQLVGERWNFSPELLGIIRHHHDPWSDLAPVPGQVSLPGIVKAADIVSHSLGIGHARGFTRLRNRCEQELDQLFEAFALGSGERKDFIANLQRTYETEQDLYANG